jgi:hypothetical protein
MYNSGNDVVLAIKRMCFSNSGLCRFCSVCHSSNMCAAVFISVLVSWSNLILWVGFRVCCDPFISASDSLFCEESSMASLVI